MKKIPLILAAALCFGTVHSATAGFCAIGCGGADVVVSENEPFAHIWLYRDGGTNLLQIVDYFTLDGNGYSTNRVAKAGVHYVPRSGTATFGVGESATRVDIPLIDNGLVDRFKDFTMKRRGVNIRVRNAVGVAHLEARRSETPSPLLARKEFSSCVRLEMRPRTGISFRSFPDHSISRRLSTLPLRPSRTHWQTFPTMGSVTSTASFQVLPPPLTIRLTGGSEFEISWPAASTTFVLETSETLDLGSWSPVQESPTAANGQSILKQTFGMAQRFYRLRKT